MKVYLDHSNITQNMHGASRNYRYVLDVSDLHHMRAIVQEERNLTLPSHLKAWAERKAAIADANLRQELFHIQGEMATIIRHEVQMKGSIFHGNIAPSNGEIEARLKALCDTRPFMTKKDAAHSLSRVSSDDDRCEFHATLFNA